MVPLLYSQYLSSLSFFSQPKGTNNKNLYNFQFTVGLMNSVNFLKDNFKYFCDSDLCRDSRNL